MVLVPVGGGSLHLFPTRRTEVDPHPWVHVEKVPEKNSCGKTSANGKRKPWPERKDILIGLPAFGRMGTDCPMARPLGIRGGGKNGFVAAFGSSVDSLPPRRFWQFDNRPRFRPAPVNATTPRYETTQSARLSDRSRRPLVTVHVHIRMSPHTHVCEPMSARPAQLPKFYKSWPRVERIPHRKKDMLRAGSPSRWCRRKPHRLPVPHRRSTAVAGAPPDLVLVSKGLAGNATRKNYLDRSRLRKLRSVRVVTCGNVGAFQNERVVRKQL